MEDRTWAEGMDQETFNHEWVKRFKISDIIPDVRTWVRPLSSGNKELAKAKPFNVEQLEREIPIDKNKEKDLPEKDCTKEDIEEKSDNPILPNDVEDDDKPEHLTTVYICKFCGKKVKSNVGMKAHERFCDKRPKADPNSPEEMEKEANTRTLMFCQHCNKTLKGKLNLIRHEKKCAHKRRY